MTVKSASARWQGDLKQGQGTVSTESGVLDAQPYSYNTRFEGQAGTNPEELIAAAHASCFSMALALGLGAAGVTNVVVETSAKVTLDKVEAGFAITASALTCKVTGDGDEATIRAAAEAAKTGCPISKVLNADVSLDLTVG